MDEQLQAKGPQTQFARAMETLGVDIILAHSPQAKGRVERANGTLQDRLVKALRINGIDTLDQANEFLSAEFLADYNRRFAVSPSEQTDVHRNLPRSPLLKDVLCFQEARRVQNDWTIRWRNRFFQIDEKHRKLALVSQQVTLRERIDRSIAVIFNDRSLVFQEIEGPPPKAVAPAKPQPRQPREDMSAFLVAAP
jgi:uncharacterized protein YijF (DUF1287 family)